MRNAICRSCGAAVLFVPHVRTGNWMILNAEPCATGNVAVRNGLAHVEGGDRVGLELFEERYVPHHATCPKANEWRDRR